MSNTAKILANQKQIEDNNNDVKRYIANMSDCYIYMAKTVHLYRIAEYKKHAKYWSDGIETLSKKNVILEKENHKLFKIL